jgi:hypothetical protein
MRILSVALLAALSSSVYAVEGMWQPHQLKALAEDIEAKGLALDPQKIGDLQSHPLNAVVGLGFCTASFVSPTGLVVTNHHCAYGTIQYNSKPERNLLRDGFLAKTFGEELPGEPNARVYVTESITDVSSKLRKGLPDGAKNGLARFRAIDERQKALVKDCEKAGGYRCDVYVFHGGASYFLVKLMEIRDVRLVYNPTEAVGKFGGDTDNWIWPRHTGDFSFLRAYVGPDGKPADYSTSNVPYRPKSFLKISQTGVSDGDFVMIAGYPGRTNRYRLSDEVNDAISFTYPTQIARVREILDVIASNSKDRPDAAIKYAATVASLNNGLKNFEGNRDGFAKFDAVALKQNEEQKILAWAEKNKPAGVTAYRDLKALITEVRATRERDQILGYLNQSGITTTARTLYRINIEREKPDAKREYGFQTRDEARIEGGLRQLDKRWDPKVDRALMEYVLNRYLMLPETQRVPELDRWLGVNGSENQLKSKLDSLFAQSKLGDLDTRLQLFRAGRKAIESASDPALQMAVALMPATLRIEQENKTRAGRETMLRPVWMDTRIAYASSIGKQVYPDANNSLRVTYGNVMGYAPKDGLQMLPFTYLEGIVEKHTGSGEFDATKAQLDVISAKRFGPYSSRTPTGTQSVPVNFLSDLDITGGNSGSPTLNSKGELVGLAFDGNYEAISSGWVFNPKLTRTIHVDSRYMLWLMDEVDQADNLLKEMVLEQ